MPSLSEPAPLPQCVNVVNTVDDKFDDSYQVKKRDVRLGRTALYCRVTMSMNRKASPMQLRCWLCDCRREQNQNGRWGERGGGAVTSELKYSTGKGRRLWQVVLTYNHTLHYFFNHIPFKSRMTFLVVRTEKNM